MLNLFFIKKKGLLLDSHLLKMSTMRKRNMFFSFLRMKKTISWHSSMDSDLEAFSHNPTDGSFAALVVQPTAMTKYLNQRFLSY